MLLSVCWSTCMHTGGCVAKQPMSRERGSGLTFHCTESHGFLCSSLAHCCSGLSMLAYPSFLLAMLSQHRDREGSLVPSQCMAFLLGCNGLGVKGAYYGVWTSTLQDSPSPTRGRGLSLKHHYLPCPHPSPAQVYGRDIMGQIWDL